MDGWIVGWIIVWTDEWIDDSTSVSFPRHKTNILIQYNTTLVDPPLLPFLYALSTVPYPPTVCVCIYNCNPTPASQQRKIQQRVPTIII